MPQASPAPEPETAPEQLTTAYVFAKEDGLWSLFELRIPREWIHDTEIATRISSGRSLLRTLEVHNHRMGRSKDR